MKYSTRSFSVLITLLLCCFIYTGNAQSNTAGLVVKTQQGEVRGTTEKEVYVWRGIKYAKAPTGDLRFRDPQTPDSWTGVKDAIAFGPVANQSPRFVGTKDKVSEDCLFLNIWSPAADGKKRPVMFWIHGGGFVGGSGSADMYDGAQISKRGDVVVVTINYRLGPFGFLYFDNIPGAKGGFENNLGIKDQVAALKWVKENIAAFGGDPDAVTIFGESAGGISVETLMSVPAANGLFKRAIVESGPAGDVWTPELATKVTTLFLKQVHVAPDSLYLLKQVSADSMNTAMLRLMKQMVADTNLPKTFAPTVDGSFLPHNLLTAIQNGQSKSVELLIGTNHDEANLFAMKRLKMAPVNKKQLEPYMSKFNRDEQNQLIAAYKAYPSRSGILDMITDGIFTMPSVRFAALQSAYADTYMYRFDWTSAPLKWVGLRACHGLEIPFVFGTFDSKLGKKVLLLANRKRIHQLSDEMQLAWINFARTGNPNTAGSNNWKKYDTTARNTIIYDKKDSYCSDPKAAQRKAWGTLNLFE